MALPAQQSGGRIEADPAGARQIDLGPGMQVGEILLCAGRSIERLDVGPQLNKIYSDSLKSR
jgi:hypothetical protein